MNGWSQVLFVPFPDRVCVGHLKTLKRKRLMVWDHAGRNVWIARTAEGFVKNARQALSRLGVSAGDVQLPDNRVRQNVTILVENSYHARRLVKFLPRWEVRDAVPVVTDNPWWDVDQDPDETPPPGRISTLMHAVRYGIACDVLVRATAGTGALNWNIIRGGSHREGTRPKLLVDFSDESGGREQADADVRRREYLVQGLVAVRAIPKGQEKHT